MKFLQWCAEDRTQNQSLIDKFNETTNPREKDLLIASITHHLHPELLYEKVYPCLKDVELAPKEVFGRDLPEPPEGLIGYTDVNGIENRIKITNAVHSYMSLQKYSKQYCQNKMENVILHEPLSLDKEDNDDYSL